MAGCISWAEKYKGTQHYKGYGDIYIKEKGRKYKAHRLAYAEANGLDVDDLGDAHVLHSCDNPSCINPAHLRIGTNRDNMLDMISRGRGGNQKLSVDDVRAIRALYAEGIRQHPIAALFGVGQDQISRIVNFKRFVEVV